MDSQLDFMHSMKNMMEALTDLAATAGLHDITISN